MLPGFRFLFAAVVLSVSTLVFGLGAAALLRASHEQFASLPALMTAPTPAPALPLPAETVAAPQQDTAPLTLAMLRVENPVVKAASSAAVGNIASPPPSDSAPTPSPRPPLAQPPLAEVLPVAMLPPPAALSQIRQETVQEPGKVEAVSTPRPDEAAATITTPASVATAIAAEPAATPAPEAQTAATSESEPSPSNAPVKAAELPVAPAPDTPAIAMEAPAPPPLPAVEAAAIPTPVADSPTKTAASDAPIQTAMLNQEAPPVATTQPPITISGPIPLPRSRTWALARSHPPRQTVKRRKLATRSVRPRTVRPAAPAAAPVQAPTGLFPFGQ